MWYIKYSNSCVQLKKKENDERLSNDTQIIRLHSQLTYIAYTKKYDKYNIVD